MVEKTEQRPKRKRFFEVEVPSRYTLVLLYASADVSEEGLVSNRLVEGVANGVHWANLLREDTYKLKLRPSDIQKIGETLLNFDSRLNVAGSSREAIASIGSFSEPYFDNYYRVFCELHEAYIKAGGRPNSRLMDAFERKRSGAAG